MDSDLFYAPSGSAAVAKAIQRLQRSGCVFTDTPSDSVTHLLLPIPSLTPDGNIKGGGNLNELLSQLPRNICIFGGNLPIMHHYKIYDLLQDPAYLAENAYITAHCAVRILMNQWPSVLRGCKILVIGWGRIGKCLAALLRSLEADVTVAARKESDRAILTALGYTAVDTNNILCKTFRVIFNTVPSPISLHDEADCLKIDLASVQGIPGSDVISARGLPGKDAPEASGELIARTVLRLLEDCV